jgi:hypothetical protein
MAVIGPTAWDGPGITRRLAFGLHQACARDERKSSRVLPCFSPAQRVAAMPSRFIAIARAGPGRRRLPLPTRAAPARLVHHRAQLGVACGCDSLPRHKRDGVQKAAPGLRSAGRLAWGELSCRSIDTAADLSPVPQPGRWERAQHDARHAPPPAAPQLSGRDGPRRCSNTARRERRRPWPMAASSASDVTDLRIHVEVFPARSLGECSVQRDRRLQYEAAPGPADCIRPDAAAHVPQAISQPAIIRRHKTTRNGQSSRAGSQ